MPKQFTTQDFKELDNKFHNLPILEELSKLLGHNLRFVLVSVIPEEQVVLEEDGSKQTAVMVRINGFASLDQVKDICSWTFDMALRQTLEQHTRAEKRVQRIV